MSDLVKVGRPHYVKYSEVNEGETLIDGVYAYSKEGKFGVQHYFENEEGETICLNKAGMLDKFVDNSLWEGRRVKIVYGGKKPIEKGAYAGKEAQTFEFFVDPKEKKGSTNLTNVNPDELD